MNQRLATKEPGWGTAERHPALRASMPAPRDAANDPGHATRVLLVDDDPDALDTLAFLLRHVGYDVAPARSMAEAIAVAAVREIDVLVSDLDMPGGNGCALLAALRIREATRDVPAIALSGHADPRSVEVAMRAGFRVHLRKPSRVDVVRQAIDQLVGERRAAVVDG